MGCSTLILKGECAEANAFTVFGEGLEVLYNGLQLERTKCAFLGKKFGLMDPGI
jgi:hypothetical protein